MPEPLDYESPRRSNEEMSGGRNPPEDSRKTVLRDLMFYTLGFLGIIGGFVWFAWWKLRGLFW
jgi:hypothetical protein